MSRSSRPSATAPGGETSRQLRPPSTVRSTVPLEPATQAVERLTAASPRNRESLPVSFSAQPTPRNPCASLPFTSLPFTS